MKNVNDIKNVYQAFGLNIDSELLFPDMPQVRGTADVAIRYGRVPDSIPNASAVGVRYQASPEAFLLQVDGVASYYSENGRSVTIERKNGASEEEIRLFLLGSVMGGLLHQRGILALHASAVAVDGGAALFTGPSGIGKSTLAGGFERMGFSLLADDVCGVQVYDGQKARVMPGFPWLKLWGDALKRLEMDKAGLKRIRLDSNFEKYFVPFDTAGGESKPVRSLFILNATNTEGFEIRELTGMDRIEPLMANTYRPRFLKVLGDPKNHFRQCSLVANQARVFKVSRPKQGFLLQELLDLVERQW